MNSALPPLSGPTPPGLPVLRRAGVGVVGLVALGLGVAGLAATGAGRAVAQEQPGDKPAGDKGFSAPAASGIWVAELDRDAETGAVHLLLSAGREAGIDRGDGLDVERGGKKIGHATVFASYPDMAVARVDAVEGKLTVARGDWVRPRTKGAGPRTPSEDPIKIKSDEGGITIAAGLERGLRSGLEAKVIRDGKVVGRIRIEDAADGQAKAKIVEGEARTGDTLALRFASIGEHEGAPAAENDLTREELRRLEREAETPRGIDFVATGFLGIVAELEHPIPVASACHIGVLVRRIVAGSPAEKAKIRPGDRVVAVDDRIVRTPSEIYRAVSRRPGDFVKVTLARDDVLQTVSADFRKRY